MKKARKNKRTKKGRRSRNLSPANGKEKRHVWLNVLPKEIWLKVKRGITLWEALQEVDVPLEGECGGLCKCGKCKIRIITAIGPPTKEEVKLLSNEELEKGVRLACCTKIRKSLVIYTETFDEEVEFFQILKHGRMPDIELNPLLTKCAVEVSPPSQEHPEADLERIRQALGPGYENLMTTYHCLSSLYEDIRATDFKGAALLHDKYLLAWQSLDMLARSYGVIFDIGTSTLVAKLVNLLDGQELAVISRLNSQSRHGSDVISRIQFIRENSTGLTRMRELLLKDLNLLTRRLTEAGGLVLDDILVAVAVGNTTMQHILLGLDPRGIAEAPFSPVTTEGLTFRAKDVGLHLHPDAMFYILPSKSGYIGGDLIGFILASGAFDQTDRVVLGLDFGTNGEIFLGNKNKILTCSAAAGPALEGARITHGMIGKAGAIERFHSEEHQINYRVIGNIKPKGICGSGLVDLVALLLHYGLIDSEGLLQPFNQTKARDVDDHGFLEKANEPSRFLIVPATESIDGREIYLTQNDVRELQLAKGAIGAGIKILLKKMGVQVGDIDVIYLAGALGNYINPMSAMRVGLIPKVDPERIVSLGNTASTGARMVLLSRRHWERSIEIKEFVEHVELSSHPDFSDCFVEQIDFPTENLW